MALPFRLGAAKMRRHLNRGTVMTKMMARVVLLAVCGIAILAARADEAAAQGFINNLTNAGPEPADNRQVAMRDGRQIAGYGGKCVHAEGEMRRGALLVMRDCDPNSVNQRFKFEGNHLKTSLRLADAPNGWRTMCVTSVGEERLSLETCAGSGGVGIMGAMTNQSLAQQWRIEGRAIRRFDGSSCFDVYKSQTGNGTPVIHFRCNGDANQQWGWR